MKSLIYSTIFFCFFLMSCKKSNVSGNGTTNAIPVYFEILDKNGENIIHSAKDSLTVTYTLNGVNKTSPLDIYKVENSATDTSMVSKYNGFVVSDRIFPDVNNQYNQGYMTYASSGNVRNFNLYLKGLNIGTFYFDYLAANFTFNSIPATPAYLLGVYVDGPLIEYHVDGQGNNIFVFKQ